MVLWASFIVFVLGTLAVYRYAERDVAAPVLLFLLTWDAAIALALVNQHLWRYPVGWLTCAILVVGAVIFVAVSMLVRSLLQRRHAVRAPLPEYHYGSGLAIAGILLADGVITAAVALMARSIIQIAHWQGGLGATMEEFRLLTSVSHAAALPAITAQLFRLSQLLAFVLAVLAAHVIATGAWRRYRLATLALLSGMGAYVVLCFLSSDRLLILGYLIAFGAMLLCFLQARRGVDGVPLRTLLLCAASVALIIGGFVAIAPLIGRRREESPLAYLAMYGGGSIPLLDAFLRAPTPSSSVFGLESFYAFNLKLFNSGHTMGLLQFPAGHQESRYIHNTYMGNVYTAYRRWIYDFGLLGAAVMQVIVATIINAVYYAHKYLRGRFWLFRASLYAWLVYTVVFYPIDGLLPSQYFSFSALVSVAMLFVICAVVEWVLGRPGASLLRQARGSTGSASVLLPALVDGASEAGSSMHPGADSSLLPEPDCSPLPETDSSLHPELVEGCKGRMNLAATGSLKVNAGMNMLLQLSIILIPLITVPYVTRTLTPGGFGKAGFVLSIVGYFAMVAQVGIPTYGITACARVRDDLPLLRQTAKELLLLSLGFALVAYALLAAFVVAVPQLRADWRLYAVLSVQILLQAVGVEWVFKALEQYSYLTFVSVGIRLLMLGAIFVFVRGPGDVLAFALISVISLAGAGLINIVRARSLFVGETAGPLSPRRHLRATLTFFWLTVAAAVYTQIDSVLLGFLKNQTELGYYTLAVRVKTALVAMVTALGAVLLPRVSYHAERDEWDDVSRLITTALNVVLLLALPLALFFTIFAGPTMGLLGGRGFASSVPMLQLIMGSIVFIGLTNIIGFQLLVPTRREKVVVHSVVVGALVDIALNVALVPAFGGRGTAIATLLAEATVLVYQLVVARELALPALRQIGWITLGLALVAGSVVSAGVLLLGLHDMGGFLLGAVVFFGAYAAVLLLRRDPVVFTAASTVVGKLKRGNNA